MTKPFLFLDVDGVLNRISTTGDSWPDFELHKAMPFGRGPYHLHLSRAMGAALSALPVEIVWLTTWAEEAPRLIAPLLGLPEYPVAGVGGIYGNWKWACLENYIDSHDPHRPFIWIDDDAIPWTASADFNEMGWDKHLLIRPDERLGVTPEHIEEIARFCKEHGDDHEHGDREDVLLPGGYIDN